MRKFIVVKVNHGTEVTVTFHRLSNYGCDEHWYETITDSSWLRLQRLAGKYHMSLTTYPDNEPSTGYIMEICSSNWNGGTK